MAFRAVAKTAAGAGAGVGIYLAYDADARDEVVGAARGSTRFARAVYHSCVVSADYKMSLRGLQGDAYEVKKAEVHQRAAERLLKGDAYEAKKAEVHQQAAERLLKVCMKHGGVYTKFGQHIASMNHILPPEYTTTLSVLQDRNPSVPLEEVERTILRELGGSIADLFLEFDAKAIAAASLAQVHRAVTKTGEEVAVKLQYPGLEAQVERDITTMRLLAQAMGTVFPEYEYTWLFPEFEETITLELDFVQEGVNGERVASFNDGDNDFVQEGANSERVARMFKDRQDIAVPKVHWDYSTRRVMTMDFIHGIKITNRQAIEEAGLDPRQVAKTVASSFGEMIYYHGFLHCDPHPGNLMVREMPATKTGRKSRSAKKPKQHQVVLLDHGMYRRLEPDFRLAYCRLWKAFLTRDTKLGKQQAVILGLTPDEYDALSLVLTWRPATTKTPMGTRITEEERARLREKYKGVVSAEEERARLREKYKGVVSAQAEERARLREKYKGVVSAEAVNNFLERLPRDMLFVLRTSDLIRGLNKDLGGTSQQRLRLMGEAGADLIRGLNKDLGGTSSACGSWAKREGRKLYLKTALRLQMEAAGIRFPPPPQLVWPGAPVNKLVSSEMGYKSPALSSAWDLARLRLGLWIADSTMRVHWWWKGYKAFTTRDIG
ncbi:ABC1 family-domain-containing protein [Tribonema minus]|uniref:ABC1 family-domain-containing protein n=1 Tax=Tribonema minus TaxID=303371 RepID=A0A835ZCM7_9STRA|nr:ABC1 family-domain-containing protein [Tribonema minus]